MAEGEGHPCLSEEETRAALPLALDVLKSHYISKCFSIAIKLDIPTIIGKSDHPLSVEEIAQQTGREEINLDYLQRILRFLSSKGIFSEHPGPTFSLTNISQLLRTDIPGELLRNGTSIGSISASSPIWEVWGNLEHCVFSKTKKIPFVEVVGKPFFEHLAEDAEELGIFHGWMTFGTSKNAQKICDVYAEEWKKMKPGTRILDIGGAAGSMMKTLKKSYPELHCMVFDLPGVVSRLQDKPDNIEFVSGDFFEPSTIPKADVILLQRILHNWKDDDCIRILKSSSAAIPTGGKVLVLDHVLPEAGEPTKCEEFALDLFMMLIIGGKERTLREWKHIFEQSGLKFTRVVPGYHLIEAIKL